MASADIEFSLVIPTFNESQNILILLNQVAKILENESYEILVVDDDSPDRTWALVEEYSRTHRSVRLIHRKIRNGLSAAILNGFVEARGRFLGVMDADLSHDPRVLIPLLAELRKGALMAVASRRVPGGGADRWPWFRRLYSSFATSLARLFLHINLNDPMSGFFVMQRGAFESVKDSLNPRGYKILLEIVTRAQIHSISEIPFIFRDRTQGHSKLTGKVAWEYLRTLWDLRAYSPISRFCHQLFPTKR